MNRKRTLCTLLAALMLLVTGCAPWGPPADGSMRTLPPRSTPAAAVTPVPAETEGSEEVLYPTAAPTPQPTTTAAPTPQPTPTAASTPASGTGEGVGRERTVPFGEMRYVRPDAAGIVSAMEGIAAEIADADAADAQCSLLDEANSLYDSYSTMYVLASIHMDQDTEDPYWTGETEYLEDTATDVDYAMAEVYRALLDSPYRDALTDSLGEEYMEGMKTAADRLRPALRPLLEREEQLRGDYGRLAASATAEVNGRDMTLSQIGEIYETGGYYAYVAALETWMTQNNGPLGEIYLELVQVRQRMAAVLGYDSYTDMAYAEREYDYSPADVAAVREEIREYLVPIYLYAANSGLISIPDAEVDRDVYMAFLRDTLTEMDSSLGDAFAFMEDYDLALLDPGDAKIDGAYTTYLYDYDAPVLTGSWLGDADSMYTVVHEFGHFHDYYAYPDAAMEATLDTAEIFSTALEMLVSNHFADLVDRETAIRMQDYAILGLLETYVYQTAYEEFEARVYAEDPDDLTLDDLNALFLDVQRAYSLDIPGMEWYDSYGWVTVMHFYEAPFYTFSYTAAGDAALQIWFRSLYSEDAALDIYFDLLDREEDPGFLENLRNAGLDTVFDEGHIRELAGIFRQVFAVDLPDGEKNKASGL